MDPKWTWKSVSVWDVFHPFSALMFNIRFILCFNWTNNVVDIFPLRMQTDARYFNQQFLENNKLIQQ